MLKSCKTCAAEKAPDDFQKGRRECKACTRARNSREGAVRKARDPEAFRARNLVAKKAEYRRDPEKFRARKRAEREMAPLLTGEALLDRRAKNLVSAKAYYARNRDRVIPRAAERVSARRAQQQATALPQHGAWMRAIYETARDLGLEVDHVLPLKGKRVCGLHVPWNMQLLSRQRNAAKGNRLAA